MNEDMQLQEMVRNGFISESPEKTGHWRLTDKGRKAFEKMVASDPKFYAKEFPEWVKIDWIH